MTTQESLNRLGSILELEIGEEFKQMFKLGFYQLTNEGLSVKLDDDEQIHKTLADLIHTLGKTSLIYSKFLEVVEETPLVDIKEKDKLEYLYEFNLSMGYTINHLIRLSIFSGLNNQDIHNGYSNLCNLYELPEMVTESHQLKTLTDFSRYTNIRSQVYNNPEINLRPAIYIQAENDFDIPLSETFFKAGKILNRSFLSLFKFVNFLILFSYS